MDNLISPDPIRLPKRIAVRIPIAINAMKILSKYRKEIAVEP
jgi:hypothetical protein